jgi:hypothetical protein
MARHCHTSPGQAPGIFFAFVLAMTWIAVVIFLAPDPVGITAINRGFATADACRAALAIMAPQIEMDRIAYTLRLRRAVTADAFCHNAGGEA